MRLEAKRALVTGGSRGIGRAIAEGLAQEGADIVINHFGDGTLAQEVAKALGHQPSQRAISVEADIGDWQQIEQLVATTVRELGGIDILVNNAGICPFSPFLETERATWDRTVAVNLSGPFRLTQLVAKQMIQQKTGGRIVMTTSIGAFRSNATQAHYCATKAALENLAKGAAIELAPYGITVNCLAPGAILTDINSEHFAVPENVEKMLAKLPIQRLGEPADCASAVVFFCLPESGYISGSTILVDGGWNCQL